MSYIYEYAFSKAINDTNLDIRFKIVKGCIDYSTSFDINYNQSEALFDAIRMLDYKLIKLLVKNGINVSARDNQAIIDICKIMPGVDILKLLISYGVDPTTRNNEPICCANCLDTVKFLMSLGADPLAQNNKLFCLACKHHNIELVEFLISIGANCTAPNNAPILLAFDKIGCIELKKLLLDNGADLRAIEPSLILVKCYNYFCCYDKSPPMEDNEKEKCAESVLDKSVSNGDLYGYMLLLEYGVDVKLCTVKTECRLKIDHYDRNTRNQMDQIIRSLKKEGLDMSRIQRYS